MTVPLGSLGSGLILKACAIILFFAHCVTLKRDRESDAYEQVYDVAFKARNRVDQSLNTTGERSVNLSYLL